MTRDYFDFLHFGFLQDRQRACDLLELMQAVANGALGAAVVRDNKAIRTGLKTVMHPGRSTYRKGHVVVRVKRRKNLLHIEGWGIQVNFDLQWLPLIELYSAVWPREDETGPLHQALYEATGKRQKIIKALERYAAHEASTTARLRNLERELDRRVSGA